MENLNELIQLLKDEGLSSKLEASLATSSTNLCEYKLTPIIYVKRPVFVVKQSSEDWTLNKWTLSREYEE